ncbi:hypothetical protein PoB_007669100 [Plakobranchus ocellatus]|uniref:Uncharacterized protein n=1 Tax=Plakobranchus ocellatus TaxID=259542 RepID=A0AAV4E2A6_9GAST|nr:hypothetical protein PoB_007669100 [Plakobranchus ocellatus]
MHIFSSLFISIFRRGTVRSAEALELLLYTGASTKHPSAGRSRQSLCFEGVVEERRRVLEYLRVLLECDTLHRLVDLALQPLDGHFHLDKIMRKVAKVSENIRMSYRQPPSIQEKMSGRVEVFYDPAKYPNNIF